MNSKGAKKKTAARAAAAARDAKVRRIQTIAGIVVVGLVAVAAIIMALLRQLPVPVAFGVIVLVALRLLILRREIRREASDSHTP
jgi:uncharacterized membrane protein